MNSRPSTSGVLNEDELEIKLCESKIHFKKTFGREFNRKFKRIFSLDYGSSFYGFVFRKKQPLSQIVLDKVCSKIFQQFEEPFFKISCRKNSDYNICLLSICIVKRILNRVLIKNIKDMSIDSILECFLMGSTNCYVEGNELTCFDRMINKIGVYYQHKDTYYIMKEGDSELGFRWVYDFEIDNDIGYDLLKYFQKTDVVARYQHILPKEKSKYSKITKQASHNSAILNPICFNVVNPVDGFTGRVKELEDIHEELTNEVSREGVVITSLVSVVGLGGLGKTEIARKYVEKYKNYYYHILWIESETLKSIEQNFIRLGNVLKINLIENDFKGLLINIFEHLCFGFSNCLIVFDNSQNYKSIREYIPSNINSKYSQFKVLITSRNQKWQGTRDGQISVIKLNLFSLEEGRTFLVEQLNIQNSEKSIDELIETLQRLPLALYQAVAYINNKHSECQMFHLDYKVENYLEEFREKAKELLNYSGDDKRYLYTVYTSWLITLETLKRLEYGKIAIKILAVMSYLSPDSINGRIYFTKYFFKLNNHNVYFATELLQTFSLISVEKELFSIHRLIQQVVRINLEKVERNFNILKMCVEVVRWNNGISEVDKLFIYSHTCGSQKLLKYFKKTLTSKFLSHFSNTFKIRNFNLVNETISLLLKYNSSEIQTDLLNLLFKNVDVNYQDRNGNTILMLVIRRNRIDLVEHLMKLEININLKNRFGESALSISCKLNILGILNILINRIFLEIEELKSKHSKLTIKIVELMSYLSPNNINIDSLHKHFFKLIEININKSIALLDQYFLINSKDNIIVIHELIQESVRLRLEKGNRNVEMLKNYVKIVKMNKEVREIDKLCILAHAYQNDFNLTDEIISLLSECKSSKTINDVLSILFKCVNYRNQDKNDILRLVIQRNSKKLDLVKEISKMNPNINVIHNVFYHVLKFSPLNEVIKILLQSGVKINQTDKDGDTPLMLTSRIKNNEEVIKILLEKGAEINKTDNYGNTPLIYASWIKNNEEIIKIFLEKGAEINKTNEFGDTPLIFASRIKKNENVIKILLEHGAEINQSNKDGNTPLIFASRKENNNEVLKILLEKGAEINQSNKNGDTPLIIASQVINNKEAIKILLQKGADINQIDIWGKSALYLALKYDDKEIIEALKNVKT